MADTSKKVSELSTAAQVNNSDLIMLSQGDSQQGFSSLKTTILALAQKIATGINFASDLHTTDKTIVGAINEAAASGNTDIIADEFDNTATYDVGDYCIYQGTLYKCISAITVAGQWDSTDWDSTIVMDEVGQGGGGSGGHTILNDLGSALAQEDNLQFKGTYVHDDSTNEKTVVEVVRSMTRAEFDLLSAAEKKGIIEISDESASGKIFSGKSLVMKTKTYTGNGSNTNAITFSEKPFAIYSIFGDGLNQTNKVMMLPFIYGETTYCVGSYYTGSGILWNPIAYSNNDLTMTMTASDAGAAFNNEGSTYTVWYLVEESFNEFTEISGVLETGETELTLYNPHITSDSTVEPFTSKFGLSPTDIQISGNDFTGKQYLAVGSSIGPYIDTGLTSTRDTYCEIKFACTDTPTNNTWFFGAFSSVGIILGHQSSAIQGYLGSGGNLVAYDTNDHVVEIKSDGIYLDGVKKQTGDWSQVPENIALYLFSRGGDNSKINNFKIYYAKIWQNSALVRNYIPAERHSDNEIGLLDLVTSTFYTNDGTGDFVAGPTDSSIPQIGSVTLTFSAQSSDINVKVRVS